MEEAIWRPIWEAVQACTGVTARDPRVLLNTRAYSSERAGQPARGTAIEADWAVVVEAPDPAVIRHELMPLALDAAGIRGPGNTQHTHPLWAACDRAPAGQSVVTPDA